MRAFALALSLLLTAIAPRADAGTPGEFDYYVLSLSWSPNWCTLEGDARNSPQCARGAAHGWILHGLWPQYHRGYPSYCQTVQAPPSRAMTAAMADVMGTSGLAWHQWKKHGSCSGLSAADYYALSRRAYDQIQRPAVFRELVRAIRLPASVVEAAFLEANPALGRDGITITCRDGHIQEARICLDRTLEPVPCGQDVVRDCRMKDAVFTPLRSLR
ncbi:ribonuclease T [Sulfitobacter alexandrii]|uniref:Ribonuclease T n=1 Tax=Sulfitobacter alexandrii TaxID=1917485 RepID=A0A1J0WKA6_9RHOB|nr:ribonuclease T2 [Sulfitobacter alexandrii]APE44701.1 ribonuclease T [Sulfitobacter alexandrii]